MTYKEWKLWLFGLKWSSKWFIILVLLRPIIDNFYYLKEISPFLSPLYIVGVATPFFALYSIFTTPKPNYSRLDTYFGFYSFLIALSCLALLISDVFSLDALDNTMKFIFAPVVYFFCRRLIRSKQDLHGVFQSYMYSSLIVVGIFSYELIVNPISIQISRGLERYHGSFADIMNYSIYMTCGLVILCYSLLEKTNVIPMKRRVFLLLFAISFTILMLFNIHHTASYIVVSVLLFLFLIHSLKESISLGIVAFLVIGSIFYFAGTETFSSKILPLIETDILVYEGEKGDEALLHGRMGRWMGFYDYFSSHNIIIQFFGLPFGVDDPYNYIGKGSHNDFVRSVMLTGYFGFIIYALVLLNILFRVLRYKVATHFLGLGILAILVLYSFTTTPLLYPTLLYIVIPFFAMLALPEDMMN